MVQMSMQTPPKNKEEVLGTGKSILSNGLPSSVSRVSFIHACEHFSVLLVQLSESKDSSLSI